MDFLNLLGLIITLSVVLFVLFLERQKNSLVTKFLQWIPAILLTFLLPALLSFLFELKLENIVLHQWSKSYLYPIVIFCIMSSMSFKQLKIVGLKPLLLFFMGSFAIATLPVLLVLVFQGLGFSLASSWKGIIPIVGSWIGGSSSMLVLKEYVAVDENLFLSVLFLDNMIQNIVMIFLFQIIRRTKALEQFFKHTVLPIKFDLVNDNTSINRKPNLFLTLLLTLLIVFGVKSLEMSFITNVIILSIVGLIVANILPFWSFGVNLKIGSIGIIVIMSILGLKLQFLQFQLPWALIVLVIIWMLLTMGVIGYATYRLKISFAWGPIALMANIGGISTAPALAAAYNTKLMPHAIVLAILSMATGTFWGILTTKILVPFIV